MRNGGLILSKSFNMGTWLEKEKNHYIFLGGNKVNILRKGFQAILVCQLSIDEYCSEFLKWILPFAWALKINKVMLIMTV